MFWTLEGANDSKISNSIKETTDFQMYTMSKIAIILCAVYLLTISFYLAKSMHTVIPLLLSKQY